MRRRITLLVMAALLALSMALGGAGASFAGPSAASVPAAAAHPASVVSVPVPGAPSERLRAVRAELDDAVALRLVTAGQADSFYAQIERRVAAGF